MEEQQVLEEHDDIFRERNDSMQETAMCWGLSCGPGWYSLIDELCEKIESVTDGAVAKQVKEKFGTLRFYWTADDGVSDSDFQLIRHLVRAYSVRSGRTCEQCGEPGVLSSSGHWLKTLCEAHREDEYEPQEADSTKVSSLRSTDFSQIENELDALQEYVQRFQDGELRVGRLKHRLHETHTLYHAFLKKMGAVMQALSEWFALPFRRASGWAIDHKFSERDSIPADPEQQTSHERFWGALNSAFLKFVSTWNPFKHLQPRVAYEVTTIRNADHEHEQYDVGDIKQVILSREVSMGGSKRTNELESAIVR